jgi:excisionase family DNA binding protein
MILKTTNIDEIIDLYQSRDEVFSMADQDRWISLQEACDYLGVKHHTIMRWIEQRGMPAFKVGKLWRFKTADIDEWDKRDGTSVELEV